MMGPATLQPPKTGRSRFSKALPAPPSLPTFEFESSFDLAPLPAPERRPLPSPQPRAPLPPVPPPKKAEWEREREPDRDWGRDWDRNTARSSGTTTTTTNTTSTAASNPVAAMAKPLASPPVPSKFTGLPPMSIPRRRPVGAPAAAPVTPLPVVAPISTPVLALPDPAPSPVGSFSSLLSAYSNHTADSPRSSLAGAAKGSAKDTASSWDAYSVVSPSPDTQRSSAQSSAPAYALPPLPSDPNTRKHGPSGRVLDALPPPPPLKDVGRGSRPQTPTSLPQTAPPPTSTRVGSPREGGSPQNEQLWKRRSLKADKTLAVPDLKLVSSHGSTVASAQDQSSPLFSQPFPLPPRSKPKTAEPATTSRAPPPSTNGGLPGRNIRPVPSEQTAPPPGDASMGQEASRIKEKLESARRRGSREEPKEKQLGPTPSLHAVSPISAQRLPTPEYGANDVKSPLPDTLVSPLSPASSPELPGEKPTQRAAVPETQMHHVRSSPSLVPGPINSGLAVRTPMGLPSSPRPDMNTGASQTQPPATQGPNQTQNLLGSQVPSQTQSFPTSPLHGQGQGPKIQNLPASQVPNQTRNLPTSPLPGQGQGPNQTQPLPEFAPPDRNWAPNPPQYRAYSPAVGRSETPNQKQYLPYSPATDPNPPQTQAPTAAPPSDTSAQRPLPAAPREAPLLSSQPTPWTSQNATRSPLPRTISETGSVETVKDPLSRQHRQPETVLETDPNQPDHTDNPGAARFPRGWYTPKPTSDGGHGMQPPPLTQRHYRCLTQHRYMTGNRQRVNTVGCRVCGVRDAAAEVWICSACSLGVCEGWKGLLGQGRGLEGVLREVAGRGMGR